MRKDAQICLRLTKLQKEKILAKAKADGTEEHYSNITEYMSEIINFEVSELTSTPKYVKEKEQVVYNLKLTNKGESSIKNIVITDKLPAELNFEKDFK